MIFSVMFMFFLSFIDMTITYFLLRRVRSAYYKYEPGRNWIEAENNVIGVFFIKKFGLEIGMIVAQFVIWSFLGIVAYLPLNIFHYMIIDGIFIGVILSNLMQFKAVDIYEKNKQEQGGIKNAEKYKSSWVWENQYNFR
jgi:hypothetical protein